MIKSQHRLFKQLHIIGNCRNLKEKLVHYSTTAVFLPNIRNKHGAFEKACLANKNLVLGLLGLISQNKHDKFCWNCHQKNTEIEFAKCVRTINPS